MIKDASFIVSIFTRMPWTQRSVLIQFWSSDQLWYWLFEEFCPQVSYSRFCPIAAIISILSLTLRWAPTLNLACDLVEARFLLVPTLLFDFIKPSRVCPQSWPIFLSSDSTSPAIRSQRFLQRTGNSGSCSTLSSTTTLCSLPRRRQVDDKGFTHEVCRLVWLIQCVINGILTWNTLIKVYNSCLLLAAFFVFNYIFFTIFLIKHDVPGPLTVCSSDYG